LRDGGSAGKGFGGRGTGAGIRVVAGGGSEEGAVGGGGAVVDGDGYGGAGGGATGGIIDLGYEGVRPVRKQAGIEIEGPAGGAGSVGIAAAVDGDLHGADTDGVGSSAGNADGARDGSAAGGGGDADGGRG